MATRWFQFIPNSAKISSADKQRKTKTSNVWDHFSTDAYQTTTKGITYDCHSIVSANRRLLVCSRWIHSMSLSLIGRTVLPLRSFTNVINPLQKSVCSLATKSPVHAKNPRNIPSMRFHILPLDNDDKLLRQSYPNVPLLSPNRPNFTSRAMKLRKNSAH